MYCNIFDFIFKISLNRRKTSKHTRSFKMNNPSVIINTKPVWEKMIMHFYRIFMKGANVL